MSDLYDDDVLLWSERQGALLRRIAAGEPVNERPDWLNIIEEVESVGDIAFRSGLAGGGKAVSGAGTAGVCALDAPAPRRAWPLRGRPTCDAGDNGRAEAVASIPDLPGNAGRTVG